MRDARVRASKDVLIQRLTEDESVLLNMGDEQYYGLNPIGTRMWEVLIETGSLAGAHGLLCEEYDVDESELWADLTGLATKLKEAGMLVVEDV